MNSPFYSSVPDGKSHILGCEIKIDGKKVLTESGIYTLHIYQKTCNHSTFTLNCRADAFESSREFPLTNSKHLFGKKISIWFMQFSEVTFIFQGIITELNWKTEYNSSTRKARIDLANNSKVDYFISIHANGMTRYKTSGSHVIYPSVSDEDIVKLSRELAIDIFSGYTVVQVERASPKQDVRGLQVLRDINKARRKVLLELGFVTTPKDAKSLFENIDKIAIQLQKGLTKNIKKYFE